jgi:drug/metabolite transporter (DMT)-like permease
MEWYLLAFVSALFSSFAALLEKKILFKDKVFSMTLILALFNLVLCIPFFFFVDYATLTILPLVVLFLKSFLGALAFLCVMKAIKSLEISKALPMLVLTPGLVAIFAFLILGEALLGIEILGLILLMIGTYLLQVDGKLIEPPKKFFSGKGNYYVLAALLIFTTTSILDKALLSKFKVPINALFSFQHFFFAIIFLAIAILFFRKADYKKSFKVSWKMVLGLSLITIVYRLSYIYAVKAASVALVLAIKRISVFFAVLFGGLYFKDKNLAVRVIATMIMIAGALLIILN